MTFTEIRTAIYDWADKQLTMKVIWADQGEGRPPKPYATLDLKPLSKVGSDEIRPQNDGTLVISGQREAEVSVNTFGQGALEQMLSLQTSLEFPSVQEELRKQGVTFVSSSPIRDLTAKLESRYESRAQMDVTIRIVSNVTDTDTGYIDQVELSDAKGTTIIKP